MKIIKSLIIGVSLVLASLVTFGQNYAITDQGNTIKFRGKSAYNVTTLKKSEIAGIEIIEVYNVRIITKVNLPAISRTFFDVSYSQWTIDGATYANVLDFESALLGIWCPTTIKNWLNTYPAVADTITIIDKRNISVAPLSSNTDTLKVRGVLKSSGGWYNILDGSGLPWGAKDDLAVSDTVVIITKVGAGATVSAILR